MDVVENILGRPVHGAGVDVWKEYLGRDLTLMEIRFAKGGIFAAGQEFPEDFLK